MKQLLRRGTSVGILAIVVTATALVHAGPAQAQWFRYPGRSCGPDQKAVIWTAATGSGKVNGTYAWRSPYTGGTAFSSFTHATGNRSTVVNARAVDSYDLATTGSARVTSHGVKCQ